MNPSRLKARLRLLAKFRTIINGSVFLLIGTAAINAQTNLNLTIAGATYSNVTFGTLTPLDVGIFYNGGITTIPLVNLPSDLQKRFAYDPQKAAAYVIAKREKKKRWDDLNSPPDGVIAWFEGPSIIKQIGKIEMAALDKVATNISGAVYSTSYGSVLMSMGTKVPDWTIAVSSFDTGDIVDKAGLKGLVRGDWLELRVVPYGTYTFNISLSEESVHWKTVPQYIFVRLLHMKFTDDDRQLLGATPSGKVYR